jgi:cell division protein FtsB
MRSAAFAGLTLVVFASPAFAQDVRGIEICTVEKQVERRTSCLQSNVDFLMQTLTRMNRETAEKFAAAGREIAAQKAEIAGLKADLAKIQGELSELKKAQPAKK